MGNRITITREAKVKLAEAFEWYESKQAGLGMSFCELSPLFSR